MSCYNETKVCQLIIASIVFHNICVSKQIPLSPEDEDFRDTYVIPNEQSEDLDLSARELSTLAIETRDTIARQL